MKLPDRRRALVGIATGTLALGGCIADSAPATPADVVVAGGLIFTADPSSPTVEGLAVRDGRFVAAGDEEIVRDLAGPETLVVELDGATVLPGLIDGHVHLDSGVSLMRGVNLYGIPDKDEWLEVIAAKAAELPPGSWIVGGRWDHTLLADGELPTRQDLDRVAPDRPVALGDVDGHSTWVNSLALSIAAVGADTQAPVGGEILRDPETAEPTGILLETAGALVTRHIPRLTDAARLDVMRDTLLFANSLGLTGVHHMGSDIDDYAALAERGDLSARVWFGTFIRVPAEATRLPELRDRIDARMDTALPAAEHGPMLQLGYVKLLADGVLSTRTAALLEDYADAPGLRGLPRYEQAELEDLVASANRAGFPVAIHAIGDRAIRMSLDAFEASQSAAGDAAATRGLPNRVEHIEVVSPLDAPRFERLGVLASMNPHHCITGIDKYNTARLGSERAAWAFAWNRLRNAGATLVLGSDWDTAPLNPLEQLYAAVVREKPEGGPAGGWHPDNRLSFQDALYAYTQAPADAAGWGDEIGSITVGKRADFVVLDGPLSLPLDRGILQRSVQTTYLNGTPVYTRN